MTSVSNDVFEVESIQDVRWVKPTRTARLSREYLVKWKGYDDPEWIPVTQLNSGSLLYGFNKGTRARARFQAMQARDDHPSNCGDIQDAQCGIDLMTKSVEMDTKMVKSIGYGAMDKKDNEP
ncbi:hypothetical protein PHMEG_00014521 [Phytophthora megakarya]|uniref:Chromo domain-containing protein n=1 Tax=Phytophthora megakarya TaxID=4795 RepID=A0A225W646_9STRA|nr:hypothetical protein PHMEG_00014521 [Phytophthora megakarya]